MGRAGGYLIAVDPAVPLPVEFDTVTCSHCQRVVLIKPGTAATVYVVQDAAGIPTRETAPGAFCTKCMHAVCVPCYDHDQGRCSVWEKRLDIIERENDQRGRFLNAASIYDLT